MQPIQPRLLIGTQITGEPGRDGLRRDLLEIAQAVAALLEIGTGLYLAASSNSGSSSGR